MVSHDITSHHSNGSTRQPPVVVVVVVVAVLLPPLVNCSPPLVSGEEYRQLVSLLQLMTSRRPSTVTSHSLAITVTKLMATTSRHTEVLVSANSRKKNSARASVYTKHWPVLRSVDDMMMIEDMIWGQILVKSSASLDYESRHMMMMAMPQHASSPEKATASSCPWNRDAYSSLLVPSKMPR
jgi:hypothetical protein